MLSRPFSCFVQYFTNPTYKGKGRGGRHLPEMPALQEGNQSFSSLFICPCHLVGKRGTEEDFSNGSFIGELYGGVSFHLEQMDS